MTASRGGRGGRVLIARFVQECLVDDRLHVAGQDLDIGFLEHA